MAKKSRMGVLKRQREAKKAEKALRREAKNKTKSQEERRDSLVATQDDLAGYGFPSDDEDTEEAEG